jgi:Family of unknown function (DUF5677)
MEDQTSKLKDNLPPIEYGYREEWTAFATRNAEFTRRFVNLEKAIDTAFTRVHQTSTLLERTIYFLGRLAVEEFMEILLLCANGYGIGAQKLVRGMYERAVTARYLYKFPDEVRNYLDFHRVTDHKFLMAIQSTMGHDVFSREQAEKIEQDFEAVKPQFTVPDCKTCKTTRLNHTWSKADIVSMARMSDESLWHLIVPAYYLPTREFHSTIGAIFSRLDPEPATKGEGLIFDGAAQRDRADQSIITAHNLLLNVLDLQKECFHIQELELLLRTCFEDFKAILKQQKAANSAASQTSDKV